jgi:hypothetical protein
MKHQKKRVEHLEQVAEEAVFKERMNKLVLIIGIPLMLLVMVKSCLGLLDEGMTHRPPSQVEDVWEK